MLVLWCPLLQKLTNSINVSFQVLRQIAMKFMHNVLRVVLLGFFQKSLEYLTLDIVC